MNLKKTILTLSLIASSALCSTIPSQELKSFALQKHRVDFNAQTDKSKQDIINDYANLSKIYDVISSNIKGDVDIKVATKMISIDIWANKYMASINPSDEELKALYAKERPKVNAKHKLRNILVKDEKEAEGILKTIQKQKDNDKKLSKFKELAKEQSIDLGTKNNEGNIGFVDTNKLDKLVQEALKDKKSDDIVKVTIPNIGTQLLYIEEYHPIKDATLEESKQILTALFRQQKLKEQIDNMVQGK